MTVPLNLVLIFWFFGFWILKKLGEKKPALGGLIYFM
jgi:flagellar biogenesis protein FliO